MESEIQFDPCSRREFLLGTASATIALAVVESASADIITDPELRHKKTLGQFFTEGSCWLRPQVVAFIRATKCKKAYDPFAGTGCLFDPVQQAVPEIEKCIGLDIDRKISVGQSMTLW